MDPNRPAPLLLPSDAAPTSPAPAVPPLLPLSQFHPLPSPHVRIWMRETAPPWSHRFAAACSSTQPRFAPVRTRGSAALMLDDDDNEDRTIEEEETREGDGDQPQQKKKMTKTPTKKAAEATKTMIKKMVRKCKSSVADVDASRVAADTGTPARLRRSGAVRRDRSFEDLHGGGGGGSHNAA